MSVREAGSGLLLDGGFAFAGPLRRPLCYRRTAMRALLSFVWVALLFSAQAQAQILPDGGAMACVRDADCGGCGWVCDHLSGTCAPAAGHVGSCKLDGDCACTGQTCSGVYGDAGFDCLPAFKPQCVCDQDCPAGDICDKRTFVCHPPATSCD